MAKDMLEVRQRNLRALAAQWGGPAELARRVGLKGPSYLSQMSHGKRAITEKGARKIESALGLPTGWMDQERHARAAPVRVDDSLVLRCMSLVASLLEDANASVDIARYREIVALVYEHAAAHGAPSEDYVKQLLNLMR